MHQEAFCQCTAVAIEHTRMEMICNERILIAANAGMNATVCAAAGEETTMPSRKSRDVSNATIITPSGPSASDQNNVASSAKTTEDLNTPSIGNNTNDEAATINNNPSTLSTVGKQMDPMVLASLFKEFDPYDDKIQQLLHPMLSELLHHLQDASKEGLKVNNFAGHEVSYLRIP